MKRLENKVAVVTGAGRGIGAAIAQRFAEEGASVACVSRTAANAERAAAALSALGVKAVPYAADVSDGTVASATVDAILTEFGRIDILVNNAGITRDGLLVRMSDADWSAVLDTNLKGAFLWTKAVSRPMMKQRGGRLIHVSSVVGLRGNAGQANYAASKAGLIGFSRSVARELASRHITSNVIAPGFIVSDMTDALPEAAREAALAEIPLGRFGDALDIAEGALFLAAESGRYVTGQVLVIDGGMTM